MAQEEKPKTPLLVRCKQNCRGDYRKRKYRPGMMFWLHDEADLEPVWMEAVRDLPFRPPAAPETPQDKHLKDRSPFSYREARNRAAASEQPETLHEVAHGDKAEQAQTEAMKQK